MNDRWLSFVGLGREMEAVLSTELLVVVDHGSVKGSYRL